jgi:replicative DNA helicase
VAVERIVQPTSSVKSNGHLFQAMLDLAAESQAIDIVTLRHGLGLDGLNRVGGAAYIRR